MKTQKKKLYLLKQVHLNLFKQLKFAQNLIEFNYLFINEKKKYKYIFLLYLNIQNNILWKYIFDLIN